MTVVMMLGQNPWGWTKNENDSKIVSLAVSNSYCQEEDAGRSAGVARDFHNDSTSTGSHKTNSNRSIRNYQEIFWRKRHCGCPDGRAFYPGGSQ